MDETIKDYLTRESVEKEDTDTVDETIEDYLTRESVEEEDTNTVETIFLSALLGQQMQQNTNQPFHTKRKGQHGLKYLVNVKQAHAILNFL